MAWLITYMSANSSSVGAVISSIPTFRALLRNSRSIWFQAVNPLADAFVGSSPTSPTTLMSQDNPRNSAPQLGPFSCRVCCIIFSSNFNGSRALSITPRMSVWLKTLLPAGTKELSHLKKAAILLAKLCEFDCITVSGEGLPRRHPSSAKFARE